MLVPSEGSESNWQVTAFRLRDGTSKNICAFYCSTRWAKDGKYLYFDLDISGNSESGVTFAIPLHAGESFPPIPESGFTTPAEIAKLPGAVRINRSAISPGPDPSTYAFTKQGFEGNLFRVSLPQ